MTEIDSTPSPMVDTDALFRAAPTPLLVLDPELRIVAVTDAYLAATMTERDAILGRGIFEVFPDNPDDPHADGEVTLGRSLERVRRQRVVDTMAVQKYDIARPAAEGGGFEVRYWSPVNSPVLNDDGTLRYIIHRVEDVTEFVQVKQNETQHVALASELLERTADMEAEILRRSKDLQLANEQLREASDAKSTFLSRMSHELRTPLNAVLGFAQVLEFDDLDTRQREAIHYILRGGRHLLDLINEILDIARIEAGHLSLSPEPVLVSDVVGEVVALLATFAEQHRVDLNPPDLPVNLFVLADRQRLQQILLNLVANAIKYNRTGGYVTLHAHEAESNTVHVAVEDTGWGIPLEKQPLVFSPFERLGAELTDTEGTGVGLTLSRHLAQAMGGTIEFTSIDGRGSTFWVQLPTAEGPLERDTRLGGVSARNLSFGGTGRTRRPVVHIEDNLANVRLMERLLEHRADVELIIAMQGRLGVDLVRQHQPALVLLDLHLPDLTGDQVLDVLRGDPATASIPVVVLSADATQGQIRRILNAGAYAYLTKPLEVPRLIELLDTVLGEDGVEPG